MRLLLRPQAVADLKGIHSYVAQDSARAAARMARRLINACEKLELFPGRGRPGDEPGTRELTTVWPYVIVYRHGDDLIEILRIWHGRQNRG